MWQKKANTWLQEISTTDRFLGKRDFISGYVLGLHDEGEGFYAARVKDEHTHSVSIDLFTGDMHCDCIAFSYHAQCKHVAATLYAVVDRLRHTEAMRDAEWTPEALRGLPIEDVCDFLSEQLAASDSLRRAFLHRFPVEGASGQAANFLSMFETRASLGEWDKQSSILDEALDDLLQRFVAHDEETALSQIAGLRVLADGLQQAHGASDVHDAWIDAAIERMLPTLEALGSCGDVALQCAVEAAVEWLQAGAPRTAIVSRLSALADQSAQTPVIAMQLAAARHLPDEARLLLCRLQAEAGQEQLALDTIENLVPTVDVQGMRVRLLASLGRIPEAEDVLADALRVARGHSSETAKLSQIAMDWRLGARDRVGRA